MPAKRFLLPTLAALLSAAPLFAGGSAEQPRGASVMVGVVVRDSDQSWQMAQEGAAAAASELGDVEVSYEVPGDTTADAQARIVQDLVSRKVSAIAISPVDSSPVLTEPLRKAAAAGIRVVAFDGSLGPGGPVQVTSASPGVLGATLTKMIAGQIGDSGEIGIVSGTPDSEYLGALIDAVKTELGSHPKVHLDAILYGNDKPDVSARETVALLKAYPGLSGIIAPTPVGLAAAAGALKDAGVSGKVRLTGRGVPADMKAAFDDGTCTQMLLGVPYDVGYAAAWVAAGLVRGQVKGTPRETIKAGRLGTLVVDASLSAAITQPLVVTADTVSDY